MTGDELHWLWLVGGGVLTLIGLVILFWALFADRPKGRRRCPKCWYDLSATVGMRCSECGYKAPAERRLFRTRRRWKWAMAGLLVLLIAPGALGWRVARPKWITHGPDSLLIAAASWMDDPSEVLYELDARLRGLRQFGRPPCMGCFCGCPPPAEPPIKWDDELWSWQWNLLARQLSSIAVDLDNPSRLTAYELMRRLPDKRQVDSALTIGLTDPDQRVVRLVIDVCSSIDRPEPMSDSFYVALAEHANHAGIIWLLGHHREHAVAALPVLLAQLDGFMNELANGNEHLQSVLDDAYGVDVAVKLLLVTDVAVACHDRELAIEVIRRMAEAPATARVVRQAAAQALCVLQPGEGARFLSRLPQGDQQEVLRFTFHQYPDVATPILKLSANPEDIHTCEDAMRHLAGEQTTMGDILSILRQAHATAGVPPAYEVGGAGMGGVLTGLREAMAVNAAQRTADSSDPRVSGLLSMLREIKKLDAPLPERMSAGDLVLLPPVHDQR